MRLLYVKQTCIFLLSVLLTVGCGSKAEITADTAAGTWFLVSISHNGTTAGKDDLADMGTSVSLELLEDGTGSMDYDGTVYELSWDGGTITSDGVADPYKLEDGILILTSDNTEMVFECSGSKASIAGREEETETEKPGNSPVPKSDSASVENSWTVVPLESSVETVPYSCAEFSMDIPEGWTVQSSPMYTGMFHAVRVYDPENPVNQVFFMLKMEPLFADDNTRAMMSLSADWMKHFPILTNVSTEGVLEVMPQIAVALAATSDYSAVQVPSIENFTVTERFDSQSSMSSVAKAPSVLRGTFTQDGKDGEGMMTADVVPFAMGTGMGYYSVYNLTVISAEKDTFQDWQPVLSKVLGSMAYTPEFIEFATSQSNQSATTAQSLSRAAGAMSDCIMSSWENRNKSQDIMSQKQSDAALGYERIVDTETGDIYKIDNGFTDMYGGTRYKPITDEQYTDAVEAVIHWK